MSEGVDMGATFRVPLPSPSALLFTSLPECSPHARRYITLHDDVMGSLRVVLVPNSL